MDNQYYKTLGSGYEEPYELEDVDWENAINPSRKNLTNFILLKSNMVVDGENAESRIPIYLHKVLIGYENDLFYGKIQDGYTEVLEEPVYDDKSGELIRSYLGRKIFSTSIPITWLVSKAAVPNKEYPFSEISDRWNPAKGIPDYVLDTFLQRFMYGSNIKNKTFDTITLEDTSFLTVGTQIYIGKEEIGYEKLIVTKIEDGVVSVDINTDFVTIGSTCMWMYPKATDPSEMARSKEVESFSDFEINEDNIVLKGNFSSNSSVYIYGTFNDLSYNRNKGRFEKTSSTTYDATKKIDLKTIEYNRIVIPKKQYDFMIEDADFIRISHGEVTSTGGVFVVTKSAEPGALNIEVESTAGLNSGDEVYIGSGVYKTRAYGNTSTSILLETPITDPIVSGTAILLVEKLYDKAASIVGEVKDGLIKMLTMDYFYIGSIVFINGEEATIISMSDDTIGVDIDLDDGDVIVSTSARGIGDGVVDMVNRISSKMDTSIFYIDRLYNHENKGKIWSY